MESGRCGSTGSKECHESVTPCSITTGTPAGSPCSTYSSRTRPGSWTDLTTGTTGQLAVASARARSASLRLDGLVGLSASRSIASARASSRRRRGSPPRGACGAPRRAARDCRRSDARGSRTGTSSSIVVVVALAPERVAARGRSAVRPRASSRRCPAAVGALRHRRQQPSAPRCRPGGGERHHRVHVVERVEAVVGRLLVGVGDLVPAVPTSARCRCSRQSIAAASSIWSWTFVLAGRRSSS